MSARTPLRLEGKVAIVTGAASGIGAEIARTFVREGARLAIVDLDAAGAERAAEALRREGAQAIAVAADVTSEAQVEAGIASVLAAFGRIDVLVSNAGIQIVAPIEQFAFADWQRLLAIHLDGAFLTTRAVLRPMYRQRGGSANVICPGFVRTSLVDKQIPEQAHQLGISEQAVGRDGMLRETVDGEFTTTQDVAEAAPFFASFESNALTGQSLVVSHGCFMQ